jgi:hypothetical protein
MRRRASLAMLMGFVAMVAIGLAAMKVATEWLTRGVVLSSFVGLLVVTLGMFVRQCHRAAWIGTSVFGWGYLLLVVTSSFMNVLSGTHGDSSYIWRIDDLAGVIAERLHPEVPYPSDLFPGVITTFDPATGRWTKVIDNQKIPYTPADLKLQAEHDARFAFYKDRANSAAQAHLIGLAIQGVAFSLVGGVTGHILSDRSAPAEPSLEARTSNLPG